MSDTAVTTLPEGAGPTGQDLVGTTLGGRYKIEGLLGKGGMGAVYLCHHIHIRKKLALKVLHPEVCENPELVARFEREAVAAGTVEHPNIAGATDFGRADSGAYFLVMEYLEGERLRDALNTGPLPVARAVAIARQVASALERTHELGIIHRDLKPENIMLVTRQGERDFVKVLDFGLAKVAAEAPQHSGAPTLKALTQHGSIFGTPKYMAPEQCVSGPVDGRTDLYALGLILYEMLTGVHPFEARQLVAIISHQLGTPTPPMKQLAPTVNVPAALEAVVMRLTEKEPESRYKNATEVLAALTAAMSEPEKPAPPVVAAAAPRPTPPPVQPPAQQPAPTAPAATPPGRIEAAAPATAEKAPEVPIALQKFLACLPPPLQRSPALLLVPVVVFGLLGFLWLRPGKSVDPTLKPAGRATGSAKTTPGLAAPQDQLDRAKAGGQAAVLALSKDYPEDARVLRAVAHTYMAQQDGATALGWLAKAAANNPGLIENGELSQALMLGAQSPESLDAAIGVLDRELGPRGVDVLYTLATAPGPRRVKTRLSEALQRPELLAHASPACAIALELRAANTCAGKRALLPRAEKDGDLRAAAQLKSLLSPHNCGRYGLADCWSCLRSDGALKQTLTAIESRAARGK